MPSPPWYKFIHTFLPSVVYKCMNIHNIHTSNPVSFFSHSLKCFRNVWNAFRSECLKIHVKTNYCACFSDQNVSAKKTALIPCQQLPPRVQTPVCTAACQRLPPVNASSCFAERDDRGCSERKLQITQLLPLVFMAKVVNKSNRGQNDQNFHRW